MKIQRLATGVWTAFCSICHYGVFRRDRLAMFSWAIGHAEKHQEETEQ